ncbi:DUF3732 domain-containing protein [Pseudomonas sp. RT6P73]
MKLQIIKLILWPKNGGELREVDFVPGVVNVISGSSKAGKSAVIPIIDYCLGSEGCAIPVGTIRLTCAWFGILIETGEGLKLLARAEPGNQKSTDEMFILEGESLTVPSKISKKNTNRSGVKDILNRLSGLPNMGFQGDAAYGFKTRPGFRDLMAFTFQPQNIVANPDVLFYKADTSQHRDKLKEIFPFILGAVNSETLLTTWELKDLQRQAKQLQNELKALYEASSRWRAESRSWFYQAREYGLVENTSQLSEDWAAAIEQLKSILNKSSRDASQTVEGVQASIDVIGELKKREELIATNMYVGRQKLKELTQIKNDADAYMKSLGTIKERLSLSTWLRGLVGAEAPNILGSHSLSASQELDELCEALAAIERLARETPEVSASVESELVRLRNSWRSDSEELESIRAEIKAIELLDTQAKGKALRLTDIDRYLGRLQEAVNTYQVAHSDNGLKDKLDTLQKKIAELEHKISVDAVREKTREILGIISEYCSKITPNLDAEWKSARLWLSIKELAVKVRHDGREDFLWEIGSGANWLAYHVAMMLALQKLFMRNKDLEHPVPHLLVFDQPSQVYFPVKRATQEVEQDAELDDEDRKAVRKVFVALAEAVNSADGRLQIIVLDHADDEVWGNIPGVVLTEEWRGKKLVPPRFEIGI